MLCNNFGWFMNDLKKRNKTKKTKTKKFEIKK